MLYMDRDGDICVAFHYVFVKWCTYDELPFYRSGPLKVRGLWMGAAASAAIGSVFFLFCRLWVD